jgi:hypothetical protein
VVGVNATRSETHCLSKFSLRHANTIVEDPNPRILSVKIRIDPHVARRRRDAVVNEISKRSRNVVSQVA